MNVAAGMLAELARVLEARDPTTRGHSERVTALAEAVALRLGWPEWELAGLRIGGRLHDVGKLAVRAAVLRKPGPLDDAERAEIERHPAAGARLVAAVPAVHAALPCVLYHHERWDGCGYPIGRSGRDIPRAARVLAVADAFDAMTSDRPYRRALSPAHALAEIDRCAGTQFDPEIAAAALTAWEAADAVTAWPRPRAWPASA